MTLSDVFQQLKPFERLEFLDNHKLTQDEFIEAFANEEYHSIRLRLIASQNHLDYLSILKEERFPFYKREFILQLTEIEISEVIENNYVYYAIYLPILTSETLLLKTFIYYEGLFNIFRKSESYLEEFVNKFTQQKYLKYFAMRGIKQAFYRLNNAADIIACAEDGYFDEIAISSLVREQGHRFNHTLKFQLIDISLKKWDGYRMEDEIFEDLNLLDARAIIDLIVKYETLFRNFYLPYYKGKMNHPNLLTETKLEEAISEVSTDRIQKGFRRYIEIDPSQYCIEGDDETVYTEYPYDGECKVIEEYRSNTKPKIQGPIASIQELEETDYSQLLQAEINKITYIKDFIVKYYQQVANDVDVMMLLDRYNQLKTINTMDNDERSRIQSEMEAISEQFTHLLPINERDLRGIANTQILLELLHLNIPSMPSLCIFPKIQDVDVLEDLVLKHGYLNGRAYLKTSRSFYNLYRQQMNDPLNQLQPSGNLFLSYCFNRISMKSVRLEMLREVLNEENKETFWRSMIPADRSFLPELRLMSEVNSAWILGLDEYLDDKIKTFNDLTGS